jgi:hypothetical protein
VPFEAQATGLRLPENHVILGPSGTLDAGFANQIIRELRLKVE